MGNNLLAISWSEGDEIEVLTRRISTRRSQMPRRRSSCARNIELPRKVPAQRTTTRSTNRLKSSTPIIIQTLQSLCEVDICGRCDSSALLLVERRLLACELVRVHIPICCDGSCVQAECCGELCVWLCLHRCSEHIHQIPSVERLLLHLVKGLSLWSHARRYEVILLVCGIVEEGILILL